MKSKFVIFYSVTTSFIVAEQFKNHEALFFQNTAFDPAIKLSRQDNTPILREGGETDYDDDSEEIKSILEEKYRFVNDETSTRYRIAEKDMEYQVTSEYDDRQTAWFRAYAVRRIVGGMDTSILSYPYNVAISRGGKHWCGGAIIDEQWVLTAGHCLELVFDGDKSKLQLFIVRAGSSFHNRGGYQARLNKVFFHPSYVPGNADFDFCLLRLDRPLPVGRTIAVLNLPSKEYTVNAGDILIVTGWGSTDESGFGHIPERLRFVPVPVMDSGDCQSAYRFYITPRMLCAGYATGGKDACNHDSGGPAVRSGVLLGLVSFGGKKCGDPHSPGVYSRVSEITGWVESTITDNEAYSEPGLRDRIHRARQRERDLQSFKARIEDKKNKIKNWLRETIKSPLFLELAKKKLIQAGYFDTRRLYPISKDIARNTTVLDEETLEDINLTNLIQDRIFGDEDTDESEKLLRTLALREILLNENKPYVFGAFWRSQLEDDMNSEEKILDFVNRLVK